MDKVNRIIVLIDFSEYSQNLINFAFNFSESIDAKLLFVHQYSAVAPGMADHETRAALARSAKEEAQSKLWSMVKDRAHSYQSIYVSQEPVLTILKELQSPAHFDWVLAGLKGTGALKRLFMGSTTLSIVNESNLLTLAVPVREAKAMPKKLLIAVHPKFSLNTTQFHAMLSAFSNLMKELEFFTILKENESEEKAKEQLAKLKAEYADYNPVVSIFKGDDAFDGLKKHVEKTTDAFLVLQQGSRSLQDQLFRKFMINELVYSGHTPLIVIST